MNNWKFELGEYAIVNSLAAISMPYEVGKLVKVIELFPIGTSAYPYRVRDKNNKYSYIKEEEMEKVQIHNLDYYIKLNNTEFVKYVPTEDVVEVCKVDFSNGMIEIRFDDKSETVVKFDRVEFIRGEVDNMADVTKHVSADKGYFEARGTELGQLVDSKQEAYGDSVSKTGKLVRVFLEDYLQEDGTYKISPELLDHILLQVRIIDKINRIFSNPKADKMNESPYADISGYGFLGERMQIK